MESEKAAANTALTAMVNKADRTVIVKKAEMTVMANKAERIVKQKQLEKYVPFEKKRGDPDFNMKVQNSDRNVISNLCHHLFKFLQYNPAVAGLFRKIVDDEELDY